MLLLTLLDTTTIGNGSMILRRQGILTSSSFRERITKSGCTLGHVSNGDCASITWNSVLCKLEIIT